MMRSMFQKSTKSQGRETNMNLIQQHHKPTTQKPTTQYFAKARGPGSPKRHPNLKSLKVLQHSEFSKKSGSSYSVETPSYIDTFESVEDPTQQYTENDETYDNYLISQDFIRDPCTEVAPRSKKMSLGSITYTAEQALEFGVLQKDNSFYLRVEKCEPVFNEYLNGEVEKMSGKRLPRNQLDTHTHWPENAFNKYCQRPNPRLQVEMDRIYRGWHDARCMMHELYGRVLHLKQSREKREQMYR